MEKALCFLLKCEDFIYSHPLFSETERNVVALLLKAYLYLLYVTILFIMFCPDIFFCKSSVALACVSVFKGFFTENKMSGSK